ncbi:MAG: twin-arginine translocation signal domain-containing protein [Nitrospiraceae bacterium]|nr:MAG: twin-arginine translocation signal domain-containing protein [Nitrospiraceae bacterium]
MIKINRRDFLKGSAAIGVAGALSGTVLNSLKPSKARADESTASWTPTGCVGCTTWCPVEVKTQMDSGVKRAVDVRGNKDCKRGNATTGDASNVCPRARIALQEAYDADRVKHPMRRTNPVKGVGVDPEFVAVEWDEALDEIAQKMYDMREANNSHKLTYFRGRYTYSRLTLYKALPGIYGTPNAISHSSICAEAENFARTLAVGRWGYDDYGVDKCRVLLLWGVDPVSSNRQVGGMIHKLATRLANQGTDPFTLISVDPRLHATGMKAHHWLPVKPGTDAALACAIAHHILVTGAWNKAFVGLDDTVFTAGSNAVVGSVPEKGTKGLVDWWNNVLKTCTPTWAAGITLISAATIRTVAEAFAAAGEKAISWLGPGIAMQPNGAYGAYAAIALNGLVGSFDTEGGEIQEEPSNSFYTDDIPSTSGYTDSKSTAGSAMTKITKYEHGVSHSIPALSADGTDGYLKKQGTTPSNVAADAINAEYPYETKFIIAAMNNFPFSCTGTNRWENALSGDMGALDWATKTYATWSATGTASDGAPPFLVDISTHASEMGMFSDIILPGKHVGLEAMGSTHQRGGMYKTHHLYNRVIDPVWVDARTAENEVPYMIAKALAGKGFDLFYNYLKTAYPTATGDTPLTDASTEADFEVIQAKFHATTSSIGGLATRTAQWNALNAPTHGTVSGVLTAGNGFSQATYSGHFDGSGRGKKWKYAVTGTGATTSGTATGGTATTVVNSAATWTTDTYKKSYVVMKTGAAAGEARYIKANTATTLTVGEAFTTAPGAGSEYDIVKSCFQTYSAKVEFYNANSMLAKGLSTLGTDWYDTLVKAKYDGTAALVGSLNTNKQFALMPHYESPNIDNGGNPSVYKYTFIDHKSRLNREGRSANAPWYHEFKSCDAGDVKNQDVIKISTADATSLGLKTGNWVEVTSNCLQPDGVTRVERSIRCQVSVWDGVKQGTVAKCYGQGHRAYGRYASKTFGSVPSGGNNNRILPGNWERLSGANVRNACVKVRIVKVTGPEVAES